MAPSEKVQAEAAMAKSHFPFRRVCIVVQLDGGEYVLAKPTMHAANAAVRKGYAVYEVTR